MDNNELISIYPQAKIHTLPAQTAEFFSFPSSKGYIWLPKNELSQTEIRLLEALHEKKQLAGESISHEWYNRLFKKETTPLDKGSYRFIQVSFHQSTSIDSHSWLSEIRQMFPGVIDGFFLGNHYALLIEKDSEQSLSTEELAGLFLALDGDFDSYSRIFVGYFYSHDSDFKKIYEEEEQLMAHILHSDTNEQCLSLGQVALSFYATFPSAKSYVLSCLAKEWFQENDLPELLTSLWKHQGNISSTAKELYMHRNTLQYKLDKFQQTSQLNLKDMDQLFLCRLLIQVFIHRDTL